MKMRKIVRNSIVVTLSFILILIFIYFANYFVVKSKINASTKLADWDIERSEARLEKVLTREKAIDSELEVSQIDRICGELKKIKIDEKSVFSIILGEDFISEATDQQLKEIHALLKDQIVDIQNNCFEDKIFIQREMLLNYVVPAKILYIDTYCNIDNKSICINNFEKMLNIILSTEFVPYSISWGIRYFIVETIMKTFDLIVNNVNLSNEDIDLLHEKLEKVKAVYSVDNLVNSLENDSFISEQILPKQTNFENVVCDDDANVFKRMFYVYINKNGYEYIDFVKESERLISREKHRDNLDFIPYHEYDYFREGSVAFLAFSEKEMGIRYFFQGLVKIDKMLYILDVLRSRDKMVK